MGSNRQVRRTVFENNFSEQFYFGVGVFLVLGILLSVPQSMSSELRGISNVTFTPTYHINGNSNQTRSYRSRNSKSRHQSKRMKSRDEEILEPAVEEVTEEDYAEYLSTTPAAVGCSACRLREEMKNVSLAVIKEQILNKLGVVQFPNTTGRILPKIPQVLIDKYRKGQHVPGMLGDEPVYKPGAVLLDEEDDFHARTEKVIAFAQPREYTIHYIKAWFLRTTASFNT